MAGALADRAQPSGHVVRLAILFITLGSTVRAQEPGLSSPLAPGDFVSSPDSTEPDTESLFSEPVAPDSVLKKGDRHLAGVSFLEDSAINSGPVPVFQPPAGSFLDPVGEPDQDPPGNEPGPLDTACESLFGDAYAEGRWRPLSLSSFFSDGWSEPWAGAAGRAGLTPRHGWLGTFDGVFYRLWLATFSYSNNLNTPFRGNNYAGSYSMFLPFSRRFEVFFDVRFITSNRTSDAPHAYTSQFGDVIVTPRFLLSETAATTQTFALAIRTPTGTPSTGGGITALTPRYEFWTNPVGRWVVRGAGGFFVPLDQYGTHVPNAFVGGLAAGRYFTSHDATLGDLAFYVESNILSPVGGGNSSQTVLSVGPGTRFHIAHNYFFLADMDFPVTDNKPYDYLLQFALLKVF